jgi:hypothetical protein
MAACSSDGSGDAAESHEILGIPKEWFIRRLRGRIQDAIAGQEVTEQRVTKTVMDCFRSNADTNGEPLHIANVTAALTFPFAPLAVDDLPLEAAEDPLIQFTVLQGLLARYFWEQTQSSVMPTQLQFNWALNASIVDLCQHLWRSSGGPRSEISNADRVTCLGGQLVGFASGKVSVDEGFVASWWDGLRRFYRSSPAGIEEEEKLLFLFWVICWLWNTHELSPGESKDLQKMASTGIASLLKQPRFRQRSGADAEKEGELAWIDTVLEIVQHRAIHAADRAVAVHSLALIHCVPWAIPLLTRSEPNSSYPNAALQWSCYHVPIMCGLTASLQQLSRMEVVATVSSLLPLGSIALADCLALRLLCSPSVESVEKGATEMALSVLRSAAARLQSIDRRILTWCAAVDAADRIGLLAGAASPSGVPSIVRDWQSKNFSESGFPPIRWVGVFTSSPPGESEAQQAPCLICLYGDSGIPGIVPALPSFHSASRIPCSRCRKVTYCSLECLLRSWPEHELTCGKGGKGSTPPTG